VSPSRGMRRAARTAAFGGLTTGLVSAFLVRTALSSPERREQVRERWVGVWCSAMLELFGLRVLVRGPLPGPERGRLVVANHRSTADILVLLGAFGGRMVSRADLARWPLIGVAARVAGTVFVDRADAASGARTVRAIGRRLSDRQAVIVFPEGTTYAGDEVRPFRAGAFVAALRSGADVIPVGLAYARDSQAAFVGESFPAHLSRMTAADPSALAMCVGAPIAVDRKARSGALRDRAHEEVQRLVLDARRLIDGG
jgi:1-acyl-sn-glycerol-3-phosphate acyltransferase